MKREKLNQLIQKLKTRWGIQSTGQILVILFVFAITGPTTLVVERFIVELFNIPTDSHWTFRVLLFLIITMPLYKALLLFFGLLFGQFAFFWWFVKTFFVRILGLGRFKKK